MCVSPSNLTPSLLVPVKGEIFSLSSEEGTPFSNFLQDKKEGGSFLFAAHPCMRKERLGEKRRRRRKKGGKTFGLATFHPQEKERDGSSDRINLTLEISFPFPMA